LKGRQKGTNNRGNQTERTQKANNYFYKKKTKKKQRKSIGVEGTWVNGRKEGFGEKQVSPDIRGTGGKKHISSKKKQKKEKGDKRQILKRAG